MLQELILVEAFSLITKRSVQAGGADRRGGAFRASTRVEKVPLTPDLLSAGWQRYRLFADKERDWIDCVSFDSMGRLSLREAFALDRHFAQASFTVLVP